MNRKGGGIMNEITNLDVKCEHCKGYIGPFEIKSFVKAIKGMKFKNGNWTRAVFCSPECKQTYEESFVVDGSENNSIYELEGMYFPYYGAAYCFYDILECKNYMNFRRKMLAKERVKFKKK